jgi:hypothetical protein
LRLSSPVGILGFEVGQGDCVARRRLGISILVAAGNIAWFGGILGLVRQAVAGSQPPVPADIGPGFWLTLLFGVGLLVLLLISPWYRRAVDRNRVEMGRLYGVPPQQLPPLGSSLVRGLPSLIVTFVGGLALAQVLPGPAAAIVAMVVGFLLRLAGPVIVAMTEIDGPTAS